MNRAFLSQCENGSVALLVGLSREIEVFLGTSANNAYFEQVEQGVRLSVSDVTAMRDGERDDDPRGVKKRGSSWRSMRLDVHRELELTGGRAEDARRVVASEGAVASEETE